MPELAALVSARAGSLELIRAYVGTTKVAEMRNNLCTNPNFELDTAGWLGDGATIQRHVDAANRGFGGLLVTPSVVTGGARFQLSTIPAKPYTVSGWMKSPAARDARISAGGVGASAPFSLPAGVWGRYSFTFTAVAASTLIYFSSVTTTGVFHLDDILMEPGSLLGPYFDGASAAGVGHGPGRWVGTPNASASKMWGMPLT